MAAIEGRVSYLEGKVEEHSRGFAEVRGALERFEVRFDRLEVRIDRLDGKIDRIRDELSVRVDRLDGRIDRLEDRAARQFVWLVGIQVTTLVAIVGALLAQ